MAGLQPAGRVLLLSEQRRSELGGKRWEVEGRQLRTVPPGRHKSGVPPQLVPLTQAIREQKPARERGPSVFRRVAAAPGHCLDARQWCCGADNAGSSPPSRSQIPVPAEFLTRVIKVKPLPNLALRVMSTGYDCR